MLSMLRRLTMMNDFDEDFKADLSRILLALIIVILNLMIPTESSGNKFLDMVLDFGIFWLIADIVGL